MIQPVPQHGEPQLIALARIQTRAQIRTRNGLDPASLNELAASIRVHGLLQPVVVGQADTDGNHMLVIGERRLIAASMAGLAEVPAVVRQGTHADLAAAQAVENLQREDLHLADQADGLAALAAVYGSWRDVARVLGKSPAWVSKRRALTRLRRITAQVMREGWSADPEVLVTLNQIEKLDRQLAYSIAIDLEQGRETREGVRAALAKLKQPQPSPDEGSAADSEEAAAQKSAAGCTLKLTGTRAAWLRNLVRECGPTCKTRTAILAELDAWFSSVAR